MALKKIAVYSKKLTEDMIGFIIQTQFKVADGKHKYLGMYLSEANNKLIEAHKNTKGYKLYAHQMQLQEDALKRIKANTDELQQKIINQHEKMRIATDKHRDPINKGLGSLPNPFAGIMPRTMTAPPDYGTDHEGDYVSDIQPVGHKRRATTGIGITGYMRTRGLTNPVEISKSWLEDFGLTITGFKNIKYLCREMNVTSGEAFKYICEGMNKNPKRYRHHRVTMEMFRGSMAVVDLITLYKNKIAEHKKSNKFKYTQEQLYHSDEFKNFCTTHGITFKTFKTFHAWWLEINKLHKAEAVKRPKGLLG